MNAQFERNIPAITLKEQEMLEKKHVLVAGCGGLGGYLIEYMARIGIGKITAADYDTFDVTNLNRQLLSTTALIGSSKAEAAKKRAEAINPKISVNTWALKITEDLADTLLTGKDLVLDALDSVKDRLMLEKACSRAGIPMIHGAITEWTAEIMTVMPNSGCLSEFYKNNKPSGSKSALSFTPAFCASVQSAEAIKVLCGKPSELENKILIADLSSCRFNVYSPDEKILMEKIVTVKVNNSGRGMNEETVKSGTSLQEFADRLGYAVESAKINGEIIRFDMFKYTYLSDGDVVTFLTLNSSSRGG